MKSRRKSLILLAVIIWLIPDFSYSGFISKDRTTTYQVNFDLNWVQKFFNLFLQYEFLSWKEATLQELFVKGSGDLKTESESELVMVSITPKNFNEAMFLRDAGTQEGFLRFIKYDKLTAEGTKKLLEIINYLYDPQEGQMEFDNINLIEKDLDENSMTWTVVKRKVDDRYMITIEILLSNKKNPDKKLTTSVKATLNPLEKVFERIEIEIKNGPKFTVIKKPAS